MDSGTIQSLAAVASTLDAWMRNNVADEHEPTVNGGVQAGAALGDLAAASTPASDADAALLAYVKAVLDAYVVHDHAVAYVPTPKEAAKAASDEIAKKLAPPATGGAEPAVPVAP
jgi:hypothetical protein